MDIDQRGLLRDTPNVKRVVSFLFILVSWHWKYHTPSLHRTVYRRSTDELKRNIFNVAQHNIIDVFTLLELWIGILLLMLFKMLLIVIDLRICSNYAPKLCRHTISHDAETCQTNLHVHIYTSLYVAWVSSCFSFFHFLSVSVLFLLLSLYILLCWRG